MKIYLAGPMRGYRDFNFPAFDKAAVRLRAAGFEVFNPADHDRAVTAADGRTVEQLGIRECMKADTAWICDHAEGIALLPNWEQSTGARAEVALGQAIGIPVRLVRNWLRLSSVRAA